MATQTRSRTTSGVAAGAAAASKRPASGSRSKKASASTRKVPSPSRLASLRTWIASFLKGLVPDFAVSDRLKREILGGLLVLLALCSSWALGRGRQDGAVIAWWSDSLLTLFHVAAPLVPVFAALAAVRAFSTDDGPILLFRHYAGALLFVGAVTGMLSFGDERQGGTVGDIIGDIVRGMLGNVASGLVLFALGIVGVLLAMIVAPFAAMIVQMAVSRTREYEADRRGAEICGHPLWLAAALNKIARGAEQIPNMDAERNPATAHLFIINPLSGHGMDSLFSTHPSTENRVAALQAMAARMGAAPERRAEAPRDRADESAGPWGSRTEAGAAQQQPKPNHWGRNPTGPKGRWS